MKPNTGIRIRILEHIADNGMQTSTELAYALGVDKKSILDNAGAARSEGYLTSQRDDVTGHMGYSLTPKGRARVANGRQPIGNGKRAAENVQAEAEREAEARMDAIGQNGNEGFHYASTPALEEILRMKDAEIERIQSAFKENERQHAITIQQRDQLRADLEAAQRDLMRGATLANSALMKRPIGYAVMVDGDDLVIYPEVGDARNAAIKAMATEDLERIHVVAIVSTASMEIAWTEGE